jgi:hypothetical protein
MKKLDKPGPHDTPAAELARKVAELRAELERLPADRREAFLEAVDQADEKEEGESDETEEAG